MTSIQEALKETGARNIVVIGHIFPDGDAVGSVMALTYYIRQVFQECKVTPIVPNSVPKNIEFISDGLFKYTESEEYCNNAIKKADLIFCLDFGTWARIPDIDVQVKASGAPISNIDHHADNTMHKECTYSYFLKEASSTAELIYDLIILDKETRNDREKIPQVIATPLYVGLLTDTWEFKNNMSAKVHRILAELVETGVNDSIIREKLYKNNIIEEIRMMGYILHNCIHIIEDKNFAYIKIGNDTNKLFKDGITLLTIPTIEEILIRVRLLMDIELVAFFQEQIPGIRFCIRSTENSIITAQELASALGGGGHKHAAGAMLKCSIEEAENKMLKLLA